MVTPGIGSVSRRFILEGLDKSPAGPSSVNLEPVSMTNVTRILTERLGYSRRSLYGD